MEKPGTVVSDRPPSDITFACVHCASALVVNAAAAGMTLTCQRCGKATPVPDISPRGQAPNASASRGGRDDEKAKKLADLKRQMKENESQRTEITGYINQLSIQLHRWQLRMQSLNERKAQIEQELRELE